MAAGNDSNGPDILAKAPPAGMDIRLMRTPPEGVVPAPGLLTWAQRLAPAFYLDVGNVCNQHCLYCAVPRDRAYRASCPDIEGAADHALRYGYDVAALIGGEPTIWPNLAATLKRIHQRGVRRVVLATNGLMLAYPETLATLADVGVDTVGLSLDDFDPSIQARLTRHDRNPELVTKALEGLAARPDVHTYIYTVVTGALEGRVAEYVAMAREVATSFVNPPAFVFAGLKPVASALTHWPELALPLTRTAALVAELVDRLADVATVAYRDIPLCLAPLDPAHSLDLLHEQAAIELATGVRIDVPLAADRTHVPACEGCRLRPWCPAIYDDYVGHYGDKEFETVE